jgi:lipoate-protein ligase A
MDVRLIVDSPQAADWNMSVDQALHDSFADNRSAALRFYFWDRPSLSLGYFQRHKDRARHPASRNLPCVRRPTGGGAIIHDNELTYCVVTPVSDRFRDSELLVAEMHQSLVGALTAWGIASAPAGSSVSIGAGAAAEPFLCFQRLARHDLLLDGAKIAGSAQRRQRGAALVHGSVLLSRSQHAEELLGIRELTGKTIPTDELVECWKEVIAKQFGWRLHAAELSDSQRTLAQHWREARYASPKWNLRR